MQIPADGVRSITLFGGAGIQVNGAPIGGRATHRHPLGLLAYLIVGGGRGVTRDKLIALLWPERDTESGRNLLKVNVHELRKQLGEGAVRSIGDQLSADLSVVSCDVTDFLAAVSRGDDAAAVALYAGPFLDGFFIREAAEFEEWAERERARFAGMYGSCLDRLASAAEARGDLDAALQWRRRHAEHDPYHPDVAQRLVKTLAATGDRAGAIQFAESFTARRRRDFEIGDGEIVSLARQLESTYTPTSVPLSPPTASNGQRSAPPADGQAAATHSPSARLARAWIAGGAAIVALAAVAVWLGVRKTNRVPIATAPVVAVLPFNVVGGDSALRDGFVSLLTDRLTGEGGPQAIDGDVVRRRWKDAASSGALSLGEGLRLARQLSAQEMLSGDIVSAADSVAVAVRLYDVASGRLLATVRADWSRATSLATIADRVTLELLARAAGEPDDRVAGIARRPVVAARKYLAAQLAYRSARYALAESLYAQSLGADSTFGAAGLGLAMANSWTTINEHYGQGRDAAMHHLDGMSDRDREFALAFFGPDPALGPSQAAPVYLKRWEDLVEKYPDWTEAWYQLGDRYYHYGRLSGLADAEQRARDAFRRALSQDSLFAAPLHHLVEIYAQRGELGELRSAGARYFAANPTVSRDRSAIGWEMATALGDSDWLRRLRANFDSMPREELTRIVWVADENAWPRDDAERAAELVDRRAGTSSEHEHAAIVRFALSLNRGDAQEARVAAASLGAQFPDRPVGALWDLFAALFATGDTALASEAAGRLGDFARGPVSGDHVRRDQHHLALCMLGYYGAVRADAVAARSALVRLTADLRTEDNNFARRNAGVCRSMLAATIAVGTKAADAPLAVARLDTILLSERVPPHVILEAGTIAAARLHAALGDTAAALVAARRREHLTGDPLFLATERRLEAAFSPHTPALRR